MHTGLLAPVPLLSLPLSAHLIAILCLALTPSLHRLNLVFAQPFLGVRISQPRDLTAMFAAKLATACSAIFPKNKPLRSTCCPFFYMLVRQVLEAAQTCLKLGFMPLFKPTQATIGVNYCQGRLEAT